MSPEIIFFFFFFFLSQFYANGNSILVHAHTHTPFFFYFSKRWHETFSVIDRIIMLVVCIESTHRFTRQFKKKKQQINKISVCTDGLRVRARTWNFKFSYQKTWISIGRFALWWNIHNFFYFSLFFLFSSSMFFLALKLVWMLTKYHSLSKYIFMSIS